MSDYYPADIDKREIYAALILASLLPKAEGVAHRSAIREHAADYANLAVDLAEELNHAMYRRRGRERHT